VGERGKSTYPIPKIRDSAAEVWFTHLASKALMVSDIAAAFPSNLDTISTLCFTEDSYSWFAISKMKK
jgi:hypothetical protein